MPHYVLCARRVVINVYVCLPDADSTEASREAGHYNSEAVRIRIASNVYGPALRVRPRPGAALALFPFRGAVSGVKDKWNPGHFAGIVQFVKGALLHILQ